MVFPLLNILLAAVPSLVLLRYFYRKDRRKPEPLGMITRIFFIGFLSVIPAIVIELILDRAGPFLYGLPLLVFRAFVVAALVEESIKLGVVKLFVFNKPEFDEVADGIIYTITASLGFAFFENIMYGFGNPMVILIRGFTAVPLHAIASGIMGYYIGLSRFSDASTALRGLLFAVLIHGFYDLFLFTDTALAFLVIPLLLLSGFWLLRLGKKALSDDETAFRS
jgi:RsiW-degrading membrane proteinase PrsW (M82 family)